MEQDERIKLESEIIKILRTIYDPDIPVNIYDLGLIYEIEIDDDYIAHVTMTLTAPNCPVADMLVDEVKLKVASVDGIKDCDLQLTFNPPWDRSMLSDAAKLELGFL